MKVYSFIQLYKLIGANDVSCPVLPKDKISLIYYSRDNCLGCTETKPHFSEIRERIKEDNYQMKIKEINCNTCNCHERRIIKLPSLILYDGDKEVSRTVGSQSYDELKDFVLRNTDIEKEVFTNVKEQASVRILYERDFYEDLKGPWIVLFYNKKFDPIRETIRQIAAEFGDKINVAEISRSNAQNVAMRYNIKQFPTILTLYDGIQTFYSEGDDANKLSSFVEKLVAPAFEEMDINKFYEMENSKEPFFLSFSTDLQLNNYYFKEKAHLYKTRTKIFKTKDPKVFARAGIFPSTGNVPDEEKVIFTVFKEGKFHKYPHKLDDSENLITWIFHSHFPHLTRLKNSNFQQVFHGIKPVLLLITENEKHDDMLEEMAKKLSHGLAYLDILFATIDTDQYPTFTRTLLPNITTPSVVIYDPGKKFFYHRKMSFDKNFFENITKFVKDFSEDKLSPYPGKSYSLRHYILLFGFVAVILGSISIYLQKKQEFNKKRYE